MQRAALKAGIKQLQIPPALHDRLLILPREQG
jgi:hypothetical protein